IEDMIRRRAVFVYKRGRNEELRFLLAARSPGVYIRRRVYIRRIQDRDRRNLESLRNARERESEEEARLSKTLADLAEARNQRARAVERATRLVAERKAEAATLERDRGRLADLLADVRQNRESLSRMIAEREASAKQVEQWIASLERQRLQGEVQEIRLDTRGAQVVVHPVKDFGTFASAEGKLPWPVRGKVISRFGLEKNRLTGTFTENPGIDIAAKEGDEVIAVQGGRCTRITYLRGFGTTVLVEHGDGYYTVYAHLGEVWVSEGERIVPGRVIGTVGRSGASASPRLHFQVWHKRRKEDPLQWLG
ncbi:MAG TPA: hypothetical protein ENI92_03425, partial [Bacteroidetes bacterium]|nr:hypothetical protein [Bacteroidota bacterium]